MTGNSESICVIFGRNVLPRQWSWDSDSKMMVQTLVVPYCNTDTLAVLESTYCARKRRFCVIS
jgi:hypothetical protein